MNGIKSHTETEPCGTCRRPVTIGRWTVRSTFSGEALCDDHGTLPGQSATRTEPQYLPGYAPRPPYRPTRGDREAFAWLDRQKEARTRALRSMRLDDLWEMRDQLSAEERLVVADRYNELADELDEYETRADSWDLR